MRSTEIRGAGRPPENTRESFPPFCSRRALLVLLAGVSLATVSACTQSSGQFRSTRRTGDITRMELDEDVFADAYLAVQRLRPTWLRRRGAPTPNDPDPTAVVYVDGLRFGTIEELRSIGTETVETISLLSPADATTRFGTGHASGAILVSTRR